MVLRFFYPYIRKIPDDMLIKVGNGRSTIEITAKEG